MKQKYKIIVLLLCNVVKAEMTCDLLISGPLDFCDGLGKIPYGIIDQVSDCIDVRYHSGNFCLLSDDPYNVKSRLKKEKEIGNPGIYLYSSGIVAAIRDNDFYFESKEIVKIAYSMFEATKIPHEWVEQLNKYFDAVIVPDEYYVGVYKDSGVTLPIFVIPTGLYLEKYLELPAKKEASKPFVFGCASTNTYRKNLKRIVDAFIKKYGNNSDYLLRLHVKYPLFTSEFLEDYVEGKGITNIEVTSDLLSEEEYVDFVHNLDCYMLLSLGEGFSNTPREALACGIPVIVSDNTAQSTICKAGCVTAVLSTQEIDGWYEALDRSVGKQFDCIEEDVIAAMESVVHNYSDALKQAQKGKEWVKHYEWKNVKDLYLALFNPQHVKQGAADYVDPVTQTVVTTDGNFYSKMCALRERKKNV